MFYDISQPFLEDIDWKFCTYSSDIALEHVKRFFVENFDFKGDFFLRKNLDIRYFVNFSKFPKL